MHLALIMDGNRRWAQKQGLIKILGHTKGADRLEPTLRLCLREGISHVSFWALAKKNIEERSAEELNHIYKLILDQFKEVTPRLVAEGVKFDYLGDKNLLPNNVIDALEKMKKTTKNGTKLTFIIVIGYGGQHEVVCGVKNLLKKEIGKLTPANLEDFLANLNEDSFREYLDCAPFPNPDLIVRTGGDIRHSGYWLYASEYSEYYFTDTLWPDFDETEFYKALDSLKGAKRNFGK